MQWSWKKLASWGIRNKGRAQWAIVKGNVSPKYVIKSVCYYASKKDAARICASTTEQISSSEFYKIVEFR